MKPLIDINTLNNLDPQKGRLLISEPFLKDNYFKRSVVLLCEHNETGSFGFVLNNYVDVKPEEMIENLPEIKSRISIGGPVQTTNMYYIHSLGDTLEGSIEITGGLYMGGNFEALKLMLETGSVSDAEVRFFIGYSGWDKGQLDVELKDNAWIVAQPNDHLQLMNTLSDKLWEETLRSMGDKYAIVANFPEDPTLN